MTASTNGKSPPPVLEVQGLFTRFGATEVHRDISFSLEAGEVLGLVGGSGSGKTTLLRALVGLLAPAAGTVRLFGQPVRGAGGRAYTAIRRRFGMLFQQGALFSALPVFDNIAFPLRELKVLDEATIRALVLMKLALVELGPEHAALMPAELSGGMVKRVALARALALEPELLVLDEPTSGLDPGRARSFVQLIRTLKAELGFTIVMVTHDLDTLSDLAGRCAVLADKRLIADGPLAEVRAFDHPFIREFFRSAS
ncbi:MAG: ATP-binding cassette domain-containing protein [Betaproteobacteria bacterium]|nr:ATP-binding cassette domain-containing protein [Betaproteobacteria bacterium]